MSCCTTYEAGVMGDRFCWRQFAADGERFASDAFDGSIGSLVDVWFGGRDLGKGKLTSATVSQDCASVWLCVELVDDPAAVETGHYSALESTPAALLVARYWH